MKSGYEISAHLKFLSDNAIFAHDSSKPVAGSRARNMLFAEIDETCVLIDSTVHGATLDGQQFLYTDDQVKELIAKAGEVMRQRSMRVAWNIEPYSNGPIESGIRALPGVTLEGLK